MFCADLSGLEIVTSSISFTGYWTVWVESIGNCIGIRFALLIGMKTRFETETCSRCNGSGSYSYCQDYGSKCFKCAGSGIALTKRGVAARAYLEKLCTIRMIDLKVGDKISSTGLTNGGKVFDYIGTVDSITAEIQYYGSSGGGIEIPFGPHDGFNVCVSHIKYGVVNHKCSERSTFRVYRADNEANILKALDYQASLTKNGTVRKSAKSKELECLKK